MKTGIAKIEAHGAERIGERVSFRRENFRAAIRFAGDNDGSSAVAKENRRDQVCLRNILALEGESGKFHRENQNVSAGIGLDEIRGAGEGHGSGGAA